jgi:hypothetical protein
MCLTPSTLTSLVAPLLTSSTDVRLGIIVLFVFVSRKSVANAFDDDGAHYSVEFRLKHIFSESTQHFSIFAVFDS